jgi:type IV secretion system protein VirB9
MASVSWNYPRPMVIAERNREDEEEDASDIEKLDLGSLNFKYHFITQKKPSWMPIRAFDDGQKTYVEFPRSTKAREMPGLFILSNSGGTEIVSYRSSGSFYVVDQLVDVLELRLGSESQEIVGIERL